MPPTVDPDFGFSRVFTGYIGKSPPAHAVLLSYPEPKSTQQILFLFMDDF
jgi:hypothetical protein